MASHEGPGAPPFEGPPEPPDFETPALEAPPPAAYFPPADLTDAPDLALEAAAPPLAIEPLPPMDALEPLEVPAPGAPPAQPATPRPQAPPPQPQVAPAQPYAHAGVRSNRVQPQWQPPRPPPADWQIQRPYVPGAARAAPSGLGLGIVALVVLLFTAGAFFFISLPLAIASWSSAGRALREVPDPRLASVPRGAVRLAQVTVALSLAAATIWIVVIAASA